MASFQREYLVGREKLEFQNEFFLDEVIEGFYVPGLMKRAWAAELQLLSFFDAFCKKNAIPYFLAPFSAQFVIKDSFPGTMIWIFPCTERILDD